MSQSTFWILAPNQVPAVANRGGDVIVVPGLDQVQGDLPTPGSLVITSAALDRGPWATAHLAEGTALADELLRWVKLVRAQGAAVRYLVEPDFAPGVNNNAIVAAVDEVQRLEVGDTFASWLSGLVSSELVQKESGR